jgi:dTDP-4-amino-4,6-dideoxygalactose transaminase
VEAVKICGATPVYLDVDEHLCIAPQEILQQEPCSLRVVILQHTFGVPGRLEEFLSACDKIGATVIEDCAHSLGCTWKGEPLGKFGEGAIYSSEWGKPYSTGQGGMLTVNSNKLLEKVDQVIEKLAVPASRKSELILECERRIFSVLGFSKLADYLLYAGNLFLGIMKYKGNRNFYRGYVRTAGELTAAAGVKQLQGWEKLKQTRRNNVKRIEEYLNKSGQPLWPKQAQADLTILKYPIRTSRRQEILENVNNLRHKIFAVPSFYSSPVHPFKGEGLAEVGYEIGSCRRSEEMINQYVYLTTGPTLNRQVLEAVLEAILKN